MTGVGLELWISSFTAWRSYADVFCAALSAEERLRRDRFIDSDVGDRFALGRGVLRALLSRRLEVSAADVTFMRGAAGKPALDAVRHPRGPRFSVSASGNYFAVALSEVELGVDLEPPRPITTTLVRSSLVLSDAEQAHLTQLSPEAREQVFLRWWVRKEAVAKADGRGLSLGLARVTGGLDDFDPEYRQVTVDGRSFLRCDAKGPLGVFCTVAIESDDVSALRYLSDAQALPE